MNLKTKANVELDFRELIESCFEQCSVDELKEFAEICREYAEEAEQELEDIRYIHDFNDG